MLEPESPGFPWVDTGAERPSGCPTECPAPLHLTPRALGTLEHARVPKELIDRVLKAEVARHARTRLYPVAGANTWTPSIEATLERLGVPASVIGRARDLVEARAEASRRHLVSRADKSARAVQVKAWKAAHPERSAEYSRAYRQRMKVVT